MIDDVLINKAAIIERCVKRVRSFDVASLKFTDNVDHQDIIILNIQRACEAAIDMAAHIVRAKHLVHHKQVAIFLIYYRRMVSFRGKSAGK